MRMRPTNSKKKCCQNYAARRNDGISWCYSIHTHCAPSADTFGPKLVAICCPFSSIALCVLYLAFLLFNWKRFVCVSTSSQFNDVYSHRFYFYFFWQQRLLYISLYSFACFHHYYVFYFFPYILLRTDGMGLHDFVVDSSLTTLVVNHSTCNIHFSYVTVFSRLFAAEWQARTVNELAQESNDSN